jgi:lantibiotic modifying enzyme
MSAWCAGIPEMLLARLAVAEIPDHPELSDEIDRILRHFPAHGHGLLVLRRSGLG